MDVEIAVALKYLNNLWRTLKIPLTNCKAHSNFVCSLCYFCSICAIKSEITDTKLDVLVVTLKTQDNAKLLQQLK